MKINLSVDEEDFNNQVKNLRKKLEECQINGILDYDFEKQLDRLVQIEQELLIDLIPYYRVYVESIIETLMNLKPIKQLGAYDFNNFLQSTLKINEKNFLTNSIDNKIQFFYINNLNDYNHFEVEWSPQIIEIKEKISFIYKLNNKEILLLGVRGGCYLLLCNNFDEISNINEEIVVKSIETDYDFNGFGRCLVIKDGLFIVENGEKKLNLVEIIKENNKYHLVFYEEIYCIIPNWTVFEKISDNYFVVGTSLGKLYFIKYENRQFNIIEKIDFLNSEIRQIKCLENEDGNKKSYMVIGNDGQVKTFYLDETFKIIKKRFDNLKGNLFAVESTKGTAIVLSEDGIIYLFEENFGNWYLNEEATIKDRFFTNILKLDVSKYLLMDLDGKLNMLYINRIDTPEDLWNLKLYQ